jgi:hypothetical protein
MSTLWIVPVAVMSMGAVAMLVLIRAAGEEARELGREVARFGELQTSVIRVRQELQRTN